MRFKKLRSDSWSIPHPETTDPPLGGSGGLGFNKIKEMKVHGLAQKRTVPL
jgi:hypothetical protein